MGQVRLWSCLSQAVCGYQVTNPFWRFCGGIVCWAPIADGLLVAREVVHQISGQLGLIEFNSKLFMEQGSKFLINIALSEMLTTSCLFMV